MGVTTRGLEFALSKDFTLLINPITGAIDIADIRQGGLDEERRRSDADHLMSRGYFMSDDERTAYLYGLKQTHDAHAENVPYWFYILTTLECNFACPICYEKDITSPFTSPSDTVSTRSPRSQSMTPEAVDAAVKTIAEFQSDHNIPDSRINIILFGGEPLCGPEESIHQILDTSASRGWKDVIVTNGSRIPQHLELLVEHKETISDFRITLDGPPEIHNARRPYMTKDRDAKATFNDVVDSIDLLLSKGFNVKVQTIAGRGNILYLEQLAQFMALWQSNPGFQWRVEASHDYGRKLWDEISEAVIAKQLIEIKARHPGLNLKFESFKYLAHIANSFGWLGTYKAYWGPKLSFCDPQKGLHYVISTDGNVYHCPRTINNPAFYVGDTANGINLDYTLKRKTILTNKACLPCDINTLCGGGCALQKTDPSFDCHTYATQVIEQFIYLMKDRILEMAEPGKIVAVNDIWR